jgi:hypothetical protein
MRQHVDSAVILLHYKCGWFFAHPLPLFLYYSVYIYHPPWYLWPWEKHINIVGICVSDTILVLYCMYIPMFHLRNSGVKFCLGHQ